MSEGVQLVLVPGIVSLFVAALGAYGIRYTARASTKAQHETAELNRSKDAETASIEKAKVDADAYVHAKDLWQGITADLRKEIAGVRTAQAEDRQEYQRQIAEQAADHRRQIAELREERREQVMALNGRLDELEAKRDSDRKLIEALNAYIRQLLWLLRDRNIIPPPAPPGMNFD